MLFIPSTPNATRYAHPGSAPQPAKLRPQPLKASKTIFTDTGMVTSAEAVYRRRLIDLGQDVYLTGRDERIVSLKAAFGEPMRHPKKLVAVVWQDGKKKEFEVKCFTPLSVR